MNKYQKVINQIAKDDVKASFIEESTFRKARIEVRNFVKESGYGIEILRGHKSFCKKLNAVSNKFK